MVATQYGQNTENVALRVEEARNHAQDHVTILHRLMVEKTAKNLEQQPNQDHVILRHAQVCFNIRELELAFIFLIQSDTGTDTDTFLIVHFINF